MMLFITAPEFDLNGLVTVNNVDPRGLADFSRRVSRTATLDGEAEINDFGYSDADRVLSIEWTPSSKDQVENVIRMVKAYGRLIVAFEEGCFIGAPENYSETTESIRLVVLVERRIDQ